MDSKSTAHVFLSNALRNDEYSNIRLTLFHKPGPLIEYTTRTFPRSSKQLITNSERLLLLETNRENFGRFK